METKQLVLLLAFCCYLVSAQSYEKPPTYKIQIGDYWKMKSIAAAYKPYGRQMVMIGLMLMNILNFQDLVAQAYDIYRLNPDYWMFFWEINAFAEGLSDNVTTVTPRDVFTLAIFYDMDARCTTLLARSPHLPQVLHAHNFDFAYAPIGRMAMYNGEYYWGGKLVYTCNNLAAYVGYLMCVKPGKFSITLNSRWMDPNTERFRTNLLAGRIPTSWLIRLVMLRANTYEEAVRMLNGTATISGAFLGVAGNGPYEGIELTRDPDTTLHSISLNRDTKFIVQCNNDWNDNSTDATRRTQNATMLMAELFAQDNVTLDSMREHVLMKYPILRNESDEGGSGTISVVTIGPNSRKLNSLTYFPVDGDDNTPLISAI